MEGIIFLFFFFFFFFGGGGGGGGEVLEITLQSMSTYKDLAIASELINSVKKC